VSNNATLENLAKLARLITMGQPLRGQAVGEAIDLCVIEWRNDKARIEELEIERDEWEAAVRYLHGHYPEDVFPPNSNTPDAKAGTFARRLLGWLLDPVERTRLAALRREEER